MITMLTEELVTVDGDTIYLTKRSDGALIRVVVDTRTVLAILSTEDCKDLFNLLSKYVQR